MATSGVVSFNPDVSEIIEDAYERVGVVDATGYDIRTARRSLNILSLEWANRGVNLWTIDSNTIPLTANTATYTLPADTIDLLDVVIRTVNNGVNTDLAIGRLSVGDYSAIPTKGSNGRPVQYYVNRQGAAPTVTVWPVPSTTGTYTLVYWRMRRMQDAGSDGSINLDIGARAVPAMIAGLAYYLAQKKAPARLLECKQIYDEQFMMMTEEDRERSSFMVAPKYNR